MDINLFQEMMCSRVGYDPQKVIPDAVVGMANESARLVAQTMNWLNDECVVDQAFMARELAIILRHVVVMAGALGYNPEELMDFELDKLRHKFKNEIVEYEDTYDYDTR